jgi:hypothetical protein
MPMPMDQYCINYQMQYKLVSGLGMS